jgi:hypothetical protein
MKTMDIYTGEFGCEGISEIARPNRGGEGGMRILNVLATRFGQPPASATVFSPFFQAT